MFDIMGLMSMMGASNPDLLAKALAQQGISPTDIAAPGIATGAAPAGLTPGAGDGLGALFASSMPEMAGSQISQSAISPGAATNPLAPNPMSQALQSIKAPQSPAPIMNAGVSGSQKAPEVKIGSSGSNGVAQALAALLGSTAGGAQDPLRVPTLGSLLKGM